MIMEDQGRIGKRSGKEVVVEEDNNNESIDVNDEASDDDFVDSPFGSGVRRSGRIINKQMTVTDNAKLMASGSKGGSADKLGKKRAKETTSKPGCVKKQKKENKKSVKTCEYNSSLGIQTRSSPRTLCNTLSHLKPNQKACLEAIGFGGMLDFKVDGIPGKLGMYVAHKFDEITMEMKLERGSILITKELIGDMLGIKNVGMDILDGAAVKDTEMVSSWMQQYAGTKDIKPADVKMMIRKSDKADLNFKLNYIVLFTTILGTITHNGGCDLSILDYITPNTDLASINWCDFVWRALKRCKAGWTMGKKDSFFKGPLTLLTMIYVDGTKSKSKIVCRKRPPIKVWTADLLSEREADDLNCGGFGNGDMEERLVDEEEEPIPDNVEGCVWMLKNYVANIENERKGFEKVLKAAESMFPGNFNWAEFAEKYMKCLRYTSGGNKLCSNETMQPTQEKMKEVLEEDSGPSMSGFEMVNDVGIQSFGNKQAHDGTSMETSMLHGFDRPDTICGVLTQHAFVTVAEEVEAERSIDKSNSKSNNMVTLNQWDDIPNFSLNLTQDFDVTPVLNNKKTVLTPVPISACKPDGDVFIFHGKRVRNISQFDCSPYNDRVADMAKKLSSEEVQVYQLMFSNGDDDDEVLFKAKSGQQSSRLQMQSLGPEDVENNILDTWAEVRNYMEKFKNQDSPLRLFLPTFVLVKDNFGDEIRYKNLVNHVESVIGKNSAATRLNKTDVVFLPVDNEGHRFLIVFDLKYGAVIVFDQKKHDNSVNRKRVKKGAKIPNKLLAEKLHADFGRYVYLKNHYKAATMIKAELEFGEFEWQTATLRPYAGLILMRIMETHMGKGMPSWTLRLNTNRVMQDREFTVLTKKYARTILLSDCNMLKDSFLAKMKKGDGVVPAVSSIQGNLKIKG